MRSKKENEESIREFVKSNLPKGKYFIEDVTKNKQFKNVINTLFPSKLIPIMPQLAGINPDKKVNEV